MKRFLKSGFLRYRPVGQCKKSVLFLQLNSRFEDGFHLEDYSCIDTAFDFFKEDQFYIEIPQNVSVGQIHIIQVNSVTFSEVISRHGVKNTRLRGRNCKTTYVFQHKTFSDHSTSVHTYLKVNEQSMMLKRTPHALKSYICA